MIYNLKSIRKQILGLGLDAVSFKTRGFEEGSETQARLELVAKTVVHGYNVAIENGPGADLEANRTFVQNELCGFFNEGVGMGLYTLDIFSMSNKNRFWKFIKGPGNPHEYMSYIGAGLAIGVFGTSFRSFLDKASPTSGCLVLDGLGFYHAFFKTKKTIINHHVPDNVIQDDFLAERFDNGIGRALWFYHAGEPIRIARTISTFPYKRRPAIWSGVGLASTYAGGVSHDKIRQLKKLSGEYALMLAQGSFLATHTRQRAGNPHTTDTTERILIGKGSLECHAFAQESIAGLRNRRYINGKHSFEVFLEDIRSWIHAESFQTQYDVA